MLSATDRLKREFNELLKNEPDNISAGPSENNMLLWHAQIIGATGTPYAGGVFRMEIQFTEEYPFKPPVVRFLTKCYHMNIAPSSGYICIDILKTKWSPALSVSSVLLSICSLLSSPNPDDPLVPAIRDLYLQDRKKHDEQACLWTREYA